VSSHGKQQVWLSKSQPWVFYAMLRGLSPAKNWKDRHRRTKDRWQKKSMIKKPGKENFFLNGRKIALGWPTTKTSNWCSATGAEIMKLTACLSKEQISSNLMLSNSTKVVSHTSIINLGTSQIYFSRWSKPWKKLSWYGGLVKIPLAHVPLACKLKSLLWRLHLAQVAQLTWTSIVVKCCQFHHVLIITNNEVYQDVKISHNVRS